MDDPALDFSAGTRRWQELGWPAPQIMLVSGSGLAVDLAGTSHGRRPLTEFVPFPVRSVEGHPHEVELFEPRPGRAVLYQRGRLHSYQGYDANETVYAIRLGFHLGARILIMTNAAGGLRRSQSPGDLALIRDQLNLMGMNPLRGTLPPDWGPQFPDMAAAYDPGLRALAQARAGDLGVSLAEGVYAGVAGPSYESPAEVNMLRNMGADLVGMSTVLEVIAARHLGMRCLCFSLISNLGAGLEHGSLDHAEVLAAGKTAAETVRALFDRLLADTELI